MRPDSSSLHLWSYAAKQYLPRDYGPDGDADGQRWRSPRQADDSTTQISGSGPPCQSDARDSESSSVCLCIDVRIDVNPLGAAIQTKTRNDRFNDIFDGFWRYDSNQQIKVQSTIFSDLTHTLLCRGRVRISRRREVQAVFESVLHLTQGQMIVSYVIADSMVWKS